jgi:hypothetical protein
MRVLNTVCGVAVLLNALHMGHAVHHFLTIAAQEESMHGVAMWAGVIAAVIVGIVVCWGMSAAEAAGRQGSIEARCIASAIRFRPLQFGPAHIVSTSTRLQRSCGWTQRRSSAKPACIFN